MSVYNRRLPVYLLVDCSESMAGEAIESLRSGLSALVSDLRGNPMALETVAISVIAFASQARQMMPLTELFHFQTPNFQLGTGTAMGAALNLLQKCMAAEVVRTTSEQKGDYKPICILLTDGEPTDAWEGPADQIRTKVAGKAANIIGFACGPDADTTKLRRITETVILARDVGPSTFGALFKWVSASVSTASQRLDGGPAGGVSLDNLPAGKLEVAPENGPRVVPNRFVFLHSRCIKDKSFYLIRFGRQADGKYRGVACHLVNDFDLSGANEGTKIDADSLLEPPPCPTCSNPFWAMCSKGHVHCCPHFEGSVTLTCPWCGNRGPYQSMTFDVGRGMG